MKGTGYYDLLFQRVGEMTVSVLLVIGLAVVAKLVWESVIKWYEANLALKKEEPPVVYDWAKHGEPQTYAGKLRSVPAKDE